MADVVADVDRQRAEVERADAEENFVAQLDARQADREVENEAAADTGR